MQVSATATDLGHCTRQTNPLYLRDEAFCACQVAICHRRAGDCVHVWICCIHIGAFFQQRLKLRDVDFRAPSPAEITALA